MAAAGATVLLALGIVGAPLLDGCASDPRGVVTCLRDMADRKFNIPGEPQGKAAEVAPHAVPGIAPPDTSVMAEVPDAELAPTASPTLSEAQDVVVASPSPLRAGDRGGGPPLPIPRPERTAYVTVAPPTPQPVAPPAIAETTRPAETAGQGGPLVAAVPPAEALASMTADLPAPTAPATTMPTPSVDVVDEPASALEQAAPAERQASIPSVLAPPVDAVTEPPALEVEPLAVQPASAPPVSGPASAEPRIATQPAPMRVGPSGKRPGAVPPPAMAPSEAPKTAEPLPEPPPTTMASIEPVEPLPEPATAAPIALAPTIDAIELEGDASYISGSGPADALIRLYADGRLIGESQVEEGRWIVEAGALLTTPRRELRVEAIEPETGKLLGEAVITVEIELPKNPPASAPSNTPDTQGETTAPQDLVAAPITEPVQAAGAEPTSPLPEPAAVEATDPELIVEEPAVTMEEEAQDPVHVDVAPPAPEKEAVAVEDPAAEPAYVAEPAEPEADTLPKLLPAKPRGETDSVTILPAPSDDQSSTLTVEELARPALVAAFEVPAPPPGLPVTILRLVPFGDPINGRFTGGKAIIRDGDTLWSVAHRYYGSGRHYRTIFKANRQLISRPSRIFPGQVLDLPLVTEE